MSEKLNPSPTPEQSTDESAAYAAAAETLRNQFPPDSFEQKLADVVAQQYERSILTSRRETRQNFPTLPQAPLAADLETTFNKEVNCGGHSFEVDLCIYKGNAPIEKAAEDLVAALPFIRQITPESPVNENEYKVLYRSAPDSPAHHFIKDRDGIVTEKNSSGPVHDFVDWPDSLKNAPEVAFAVQKSHPMFLVDKDGRQIYSLFVGTAQT